MDSLEPNSRSETENFETLFREIPAALALLRGPDFVFERANDSYLHLVGRSDIIGKTLIEALPEIKDQPFPGILKNVFETGETFSAREVEVMLLTRVYLDFTYRRVSGQDGEPYGILVFAIDVTEKVASRRAIQQERQKLEAVFSSTSTSLAILRGPQAIFEKVNASYQNLFLDRDLIGKPVLEALPELKGQKFPDLISHVFSTGETYVEIEARAVLRRRHNGPLETCYFDQAYIRIADEKERPYGVLIQATEVTERVTSRSALAKSEARFRAAIEAAKMGTWDLDLKTGIANLSPRTNELFGVPPSEKIPLEQMMERIHPEDRERVQKAIADATDPRGEGIYDIEYRVIRDDSSVRWISAKGKSFFENAPEGRITSAFSGTVLDVTDRVLSEQALAARNEFMSIASHELKTPLTSLKLQTQSAKRNFEKGKLEYYTVERVEKMIDSNERQIGRLIRLVDDMLDFAKIESGKLSMSLERTDLRELVLEVHERLKDQLEAAGGKAHLECEGPIYAELDRFRIEQVVTNLLTNAIRYGHKKPVSIKLRSFDGNAVLAVSDEGIGIAPEHRERIFNRFERVVSANEISGLGLGLYISRQIVEAHHGKIWVESELDKGSTFFVELPIK